MKFSDMMGKGDSDSTVVEDTAEVVTDSADAAAAEVAEAPIRFGGVRSDPAPNVTTAPNAEAPVAIEPVAIEPIAEPLGATGNRDYELRDVVAELAPSARITPTVASDQELDATSWLEGLTSIDDDLLPR